MIGGTVTRGHRQRSAVGEYREKAALALILAETATLDRVRERHEHAAATWRSLAALSEKSLLSRQAPPLALNHPKPARS